MQANLLGAVLNMVRPEDSHGYYHFKSAYEELMKDGRYRAALSARVPDAIPEETGQQADETGDTGS